MWLLALALPLLALLIFANRRMNAATTKTGGSGRVVGIVGRMGSGKSYMAVRMAIRRLKRGANVVTNFTMNLDGADRVNELHKAGAKPKAIAAELSMPVERVKVLTGITGTWRMFRGWEQFAELEDAVVIIDEAHLYAPSNKSLVFPDVARFKMSQARKFGLDVYWVTQHENRVNSILKDLTNMMFVCRSWMSGTGFTVKGYEPEHMRKKGKHLERQMYRLNVEMAGLYNTLEILAADDHLMKSKGMDTAARVAADYNARTLTGSAAELARDVHHDALSRVDPAAVDADTMAPPRPARPRAPRAPAPELAPVAVLDAPEPLDEPTGADPGQLAPVVPMAPARPSKPRQRAERSDVGKPRPRARRKPCEHERRTGATVGSCSKCGSTEDPVQLPNGRVVWVRV